MTVQYSFYIVDALYRNKASKTSLQVTPSSVPVSLIGLSEINSDFLCSFQAKCRQSKTNLRMKTN